MGDEQKSEDPIMQEFTELMRDKMPERVITNFIVIAELAGGQTQELSMSVSDTMTPWLATGMLSAAMAMIHSGEYEFPAEEEHDG